MHDPFPIPCPPLLARFTAPVAAALNLPTLPAHIHELLFAATSYHVIGTYLSPLLSRAIFPHVYPQLPARTRINWDVHVVSLVQSLSISGLALWVMAADEERKGMGWGNRVWGYTGGGGMIQGLAAGYFLWDLGVCIRHLRVFGWGLLAHAVAALIVFSLGFRPFVNFYGPTFILYEISSPFLNLHWFFDKLNMTGSKPQWYNGLLLLSSFFCSRLLWGTYQSVRVYQDVWAGLHPSSSSLANGNHTMGPIVDADVMTFAREGQVPIWLASTYLTSNIILNTLNFYWFGKMIETIRKRFKGHATTENHDWADRKAALKKKAAEAEDVVVVEGVEVMTMMADDGEVIEETVEVDTVVDKNNNVVALEQNEVRRRKE